MSPAFNFVKEVLLVSYRFFRLDSLFATVHRDHDRLFGSLKGIEIDVPVQGVREDLGNLVVNVSFRLKDFAKRGLLRHSMQTLGILWLQHEL
jgi:hypothetical protein